MCSTFSKREKSDSESGTPERYGPLLWKLLRGLLRYLLERVERRS